MKYLTVLRLRLAGSRANHAPMGRRIRVLYPFGNIRPGHQREIVKQLTTPLWVEDRLNDSEGHCIGQTWDRLNNRPHDCHCFVKRGGCRHLLDLANPATFGQLQPFGTIRTLIHHQSDTASAIACMIEQRISNCLTEAITAEQRDGTPTHPHVITPTPDGLVFSQLRLAVRARLATATGYRAEPFIVIVSSGHLILPCVMSKS